MTVSKPTLLNWFEWLDREKQTETRKTLFYPELQKYEISARLLKSTAALKRLPPIAKCT